MIPSQQMVAQPVQRLETRLLREDIAHGPVSRTSPASEQPGLAQMLSSLREYGVPKS